MFHCSAPKVIDQSQRCRVQILYLLVSAANIITTRTGDTYYHGKIKGLSIFKFKSTGSLPSTTAEAINKISSLLFLPAVQPPVIPVYPTDVRHRHYTRLVAKNIYEMS